MVLLEPDASRLAAKLPPVQRSRAAALLRYPEDTAGGIMTNDIVALPETLTAGEALAALHQRLGRPEFVNAMHILYVVAAGQEPGTAGTAAGPSTPEPGAAAPGCSGPRPANSQRADGKPAVGAETRLRPARTLSARFWPRRPTKSSAR